MKHLIFISAISFLLLSYLVIPKKHPLPSRSAKKLNEKLITNPIDTTWNISVMGIIFHPTRNNSVVLVKNNKTRQIKVYRSGEVMFEKATLYDIQRDRILFARENQIEYKLLKDRQPATSTPTYFTAKSLDLQNVRSRYVERGFKRIDNEITMTESYRHNLLTKQLTNVLYQAMALPRVVNGKIKGFQISEIEAGSIYEKVGIQNNDVVTKINDAPLNDMSKTIALLNTLRDDQQVTFEVERGGQKKTYYLKVK